MPGNANTDTSSQVVEIEPYKLSWIFSIVREFDREQIFLQTFLNVCNYAHDMATKNQKILLVIEVNNEFKINLFLIFYLEGDILIVTNDNKHYWHHEFQTKIHEMISLPTCKKRRGKHWNQQDVENKNGESHSTFLDKVNIVRMINIHYLW